MSIIFLILPITLLLSAGAVAAFAWATQSGQFDDLETPAIRLLHDEPAASAKCDENAVDALPPRD
jgi:cbb3-type cytochrome oxidase maturation protein